MTSDEWPEVTLGTVLRVKHGFAFKGEYFQPAAPAWIESITGEHHADFEIDGFVCLTSPATRHLR